MTTPGDDATDPTTAEPGLAPVVPLVSAVERAEPLNAFLEFCERRLTGAYAVDDFGYDEDLTEQVLLPLIRVWYENWFRIEVRGLDNVPDAGRALVVSNHSGVVPFDALMLQVALRDHHPAERRFRMLVADVVFDIPVLSHLARKAGHTLATPEDAERLLGQDELVGVFPEGYKGLGKPFSERYRLQRFGRGGFVSTAVRTRSPIIPCSVVGAEEIYPKIGDLTALARLLKLPYFPVTLTFPLLGPLGLIPLPTKWIIEFGEPMGTEKYAPEAADDPGVIFEVGDQVHDTIQQTLNRLVIERGDPF
ncbi:lysophospholipid acyltransferase family protein [Nocardiopsis ansamitocini]|uniref:Glycerol acyltransferase n=1 Tax=Nocardiopsis ansamitocini TaxID=1670832 RepID=A0A9W6P7Z1_9ACTN|nr:lysophospholipid acyltransferase family protein [Nocardiopsis ansamitocini]GLU49195.1 glycerol acyltransferase [Nocardiopsis ansamitocini]